jgi:hypothetical protein
MVLSCQSINGIKMRAQLFSIDTLTYHSLHGILLRGYREGLLCVMPLDMQVVRWD